MAKEFKDFDKEFAEFKHTTFAWEHLDRFWSLAVVLGNDQNRWDMSVQSWTQEQIRFAVYEVESARTWQMFRVSLKGFTTEEKLYRLKNYFVIKVYNVLKSHRTEEFTETGGNSASPEREYMWNIEKCRIDNYIGALVRGGCLKPKTYEIIKQ